MEGGLEAPSRLTPWVRRLILAMFCVGLALAIFQLFHIVPFGFIQLGTSFLYSIMALFVAPVFLFYPFNPSRRATNRFGIHWYDFLLFAALFGSALWLAFQGQAIQLEAWRYNAPPIGTVLSFVIWILALEGVRRVTGLTLVAVGFVFSIYPLIAEYLPGPLEGLGASLPEIARFHVLSDISMLGVPLQVFGGLLVGYLVFGIALMVTGGGEFFLNLASAALGTTPGGPAKVAVISSALFGSMSGSVIANVMTTGAFTIPTMKRLGYPPHYAGAVECCASTGGVLMPPVMGAVAFIMAEFLEIEYAVVAIAAAIPSLLYYGTLILQTDLYARKTGMRGLSKEEVPSLKKTLMEGWPYILAFAVLLYYLFFERVSTLAPFYSTIILLVTVQFRRKTRFTTHTIVRFLEMMAKLFCQIGPNMMVVSMVLGSLLMTGAAQSIPSYITSLAGANLYLMLIAGAATAYILGMGMTITAVYILLSIVLAPSLVEVGLYPISVHLYLIYYAMLSYITPPVAAAAFHAGPIAGAPIMKTGFTATRLGLVLFFLPLFFVVEPALVLHGSIGEILISIITCGLGFMFIAAAFEGYFYYFGRLHWLTRIVFLIPGGLLALPGTTTDIAGAVIGAAVLLFLFIMKRMSTPPPIPQASEG